MKIIQIGTEQKKKKLKSSYIHPLIQNLNVIPKQKQFDKTKKKKRGKKKRILQTSTFQLSKNSQ